MLYAAACGCWRDAAAALYHAPGRVCDSHTVTLQHTVRVLRVATD